jgi:hypothetical protein
MIARIFLDWMLLVWMIILAGAGALMGFIFGNTMLGLWIGFGVFWGIIALCILWALSLAWTLDEFFSKLR